MSCSGCGGEDVVIHMSQIVGNQRSDVHLCMKCAVERGIINSQGGIQVSLRHVVNGMLEQQFNKVDSSDVVCSNCGVTRDDVQKLEKLGCPECLELFSREIREYFENRGIEHIHQGTLPNELSLVKDALFGKQYLKERIRKAVEAEEYEVAAMLRDRIKLMERDPELSDEQ